MSDNKLVKTIMDTDTLTGLKPLAADVHWKEGGERELPSNPTAVFFFLIHIFQTASIGMMFSPVATLLLAICVVTERPHGNTESA